MDLYFIVFAFLTILSSASVLLIATIGLAVIFGMMGIINLAHGEFIMLGAYATLISVRAGIPFPVAVLLAGFILAVFGAVVERLIMRFLYGRLLDTLLATWGLSMALYQTAILVFGATTPGIGLPISAVSIGTYTLSLYFLLLILIAAILVFAVYLVFTRTSYGVMARAAIQNPTMAAAVGIETKKINTITFAVGSALAGIAGGLLVPAYPATPNMGLAFVSKAFLSVVVAGPLTISGTIASVGALGSLSSFASSFLTSVLGDITFFALTIIVLRFFPNGISVHWRGKL
jgi:branched-chain amino acid transport system permease protein